jgi:hypothetical protein
MWNNPIKYNDPDGRCPICPALVGGAIGAVVGAGLELSKQLYSNVKESGFSKETFSNLNGKTILGAAAEGFITGAVVGLTGGAALGLATATFSQAAASTIGGIVKREINGENPLDKKEMRADFIAGGFGGILGNVIGKGLGTTTVTNVIGKQLIKSAPTIGRGVGKFLGRSGTELFSNTGNNEIINGGWVRESEMNIDGSIKEHGVVRIAEPLPEVNVK